MRKIIISALSLVLAMSMQAAGIENLKVHPLSPWGLALLYTVTGTLPSNMDEMELVLKVVDKTTDKTHIIVKSLGGSLTGDTELSLGDHCVVWNAAKDGMLISSQNCLVTLDYKPPEYCVIDISGGRYASKYPVSYLYEEPESWGDEYRTTKIVLKRIKAGSFKMQGLTTTTLSKPFFIGVFEVTQKQWNLVMGSDQPYSDGRGDPFPVYSVSYDMIRGDGLGGRWPSSSEVDSSSFIGRLRVKTGLDFDLPTEAQWEYACRAGTTTTYSYGSTANGSYMWCEENAYRSTHPVGIKLPNSWGLYDMHGNVDEWCLDWYNSSLSYGTDPKGPSTGTERVSRGGRYADSAAYISSSLRRNQPSSCEWTRTGFRLSRTLP